MQAALSSCVQTANTICSGASATAPVRRCSSAVLRVQQQQQQQQHLAARRSVAAHGILDSYRRDKGLAAPEQQPGSTGLLDKAAQGLSGLLQQQPKQQQQAGAGEDDSPCFVECVSQVFNKEDMQAALDEAGPDALVVVDFYKTACGACKYIQPGFVKLCKAAAKSADGAEDAPPIVFLKHNVYDDEEEEVTDLAKQYNVRSVPRFIFFKNGEQVDNFATRDKLKVAEAVLKHAPPGVELGDWESA